jgi:hypothetical protein
MDSHQSTPSPAYETAPAPPGMFGTKIPSVVTMAVVVFLFILPFVEIRCNGMKLQNVSGVQLATGFKTEKSGYGDFSTDALTKTTTNTSRQQPNMYALAALVLAAAGLGLAFVNKRMAAAGGMSVAVLGLAAMVGLMLDIKKQMQHGVFGELGNKTSGDAGEKIPGLENGIKNITDNMPAITVEFAPFFFVVMAGFAAAAFFYYKRMKSMTQ